MELYCSIQTDSVSFLVKPFDSALHCTSSQQLFVLVISLNHCSVPWESEVSSVRSANRASRFLSSSSKHGSHRKPDVSLLSTLVILSTKSLCVNCTSDSQKAHVTVTSPEVGFVGVVGRAVSLSESSSWMLSAVMSKNGSSTSISGACWSSSCAQRKHIRFGCGLMMPTDARILSSRALKSAATSYDS